MLQSQLFRTMKKANVIALVSKWDKKTLNDYKSAELIDVTDEIVAHFNPGPEQLQTILEIRRKKPIPLWQLEIMTKLHDH